MNEMKELKSQVKTHGNTKKYINRFICNVYYIDLIDSNSKQQYWIQKNLMSSNVHFNKYRGYKYVFVCIDEYSRYLMV